MPTFITADDGQKLSPGKGRFCVVIPAYREAKHIGTLVPHVLKHVPKVIVVDDGSPDATAEEARKAGATVLRHESNRGKAAAMKTGCDYVCNHGFEAVITMDGDGQHDPEDIPAFLEAYTRTRHPVLIGNRMADPDKMPWFRRLTNRFMSWLLSNAMKQRVPDTQSGFRLYKSNIIPLVWPDSERFAAESEILLRIANHGLTIGSVPIRVIYSGEKSEIQPFNDAMRFFRMLVTYSLTKTRKRP